MGDGEPSDAVRPATLNQRHHAYVGKVVPLVQPIVNGSGKVRIDNFLWDVDGPICLKVRAFASQASMV